MLTIGSFCAGCLTPCMRNFQSVKRKRKQNKSRAISHTVGRFLYGKFNYPRLQQRMYQMFGTNEAEDLYFATSSKKLGAADGAFVLNKKNRADNAATLDITSRDQQDMRLKLTRDRDNLTWTLYNQSYTKLISYRAYERFYLINKSQNVLRFAPLMDRQAFL